MSPYAPRFSVVTPSYNQARFLEGTLTSVLSQDYPHIEYIVIDGGSTDGSVDIIRRYDKHLAFWSSGKDGGQADALNKGFARSTGDILCFVNSDDQLAAGALSEIASRYDGGLHWWTGGAVQVLDNQRIDPILEWIHSVGYLDLMFTNVIVSQVATFWTRSLWQLVGGYMADLHLALDFDLWLRFSRIRRSDVVRKVLGLYNTHENAKTVASGEDYQGACDDCRRTELRRRFPAYLHAPIATLGAKWAYARRDGWSKLVRPVSVRPLTF